MSNGRDQRISDALGQLVDRTLPLDDTDASNEQYARAVDRAQAILESDATPSIAGDVHGRQQVLESLQSTDCC